MLHRLHHATLRTTNSMLNSNGSDDTKHIKLHYDYVLHNEKRKSVRAKSAKVKLKMEYSYTHTDTLTQDIRSALHDIDVQSTQMKLTKWKANRIGSSSVTIGHDEKKTE